MAATAKVRLSTIGNNGGLTAIGEANVNADGRYEIAAPANQAHLVVQALDVNGKMLGQAIVDATGGADATVKAPPIDVESSFEAAVLIEMTRRGATIADADTVDVRARINAEVAAAVGAATATEVVEHTRAYADAIIAAQRTRTKAYARAGVTATQAIRDQSVRAAWKLNEALDAGTSAQTAYAQFFAALDASELDNGVTASERGETEANASVAFRATLDASIDDGAVLDSGLRAAAALEAHATIAAIRALYAAQPISTTAKASAEAAVSTFEAQLAAAKTEAEAKAAFTTFATSLTGGAHVSAGVVGKTLSIDLIDEATAQGAVTASLTAATTFDVAVSAAITTFVDETEAIDFDGLASAVLDAHATLAASVQAQASALGATSNERDIALRVLVIACGAFRLGKPGD